VADPYRFLEDPDSEATKKWVAAENEISEHFLSQLNMKEKIVKRMHELSDVAKIGIPVRHGQHYYFLHDAGK